MPKLSIKTVTRQFEKKETVSMLLYATDWKKNNYFQKFGVIRILVLIDVTHV